jgi:hypothetical protein
MLVPTVACVEVNRQSRIGAPVHANNSLAAVPTALALALHFEHMRNSRQIFMHASTMARDPYLHIISAVAAV